MIDEFQKLDACRTSTIGLIKPERMDLQFLTHISDFCYGQVRGEDMLGDFYIRKLSFVQRIPECCCGWLWRLRFRACCLPDFSC
jgi:hypothetical protein